MARRSRRARLGTHDQEGITSADYADNGMLTVVGYYGPATLQIGATSLHGNGGMDIFIAGFDPTGAPVGAVAFGGPASDRLRWIEHGTGSILYGAGRFGSRMMVGTRELRSSGDVDGVLLELSLPWLESPR
jgi:hypothetical protein